MTVAAALALIDDGAANGLVVSLFQATSHRTLSFRRLEFHLLQSDPTIVVDDMRMGSPPAVTRDELARIGYGVFHVRLFPLLLGHVTLTSVELADMELRMIRLGHGRNNYSFGSGAGLSPTLRDVKHMTISRSTVTYLDPQRQLTLKAQVDYDSARGARPINLDGGGVDHGEPYTVTAKGASLTGRGSSTPFDFDASLVDGDVKAAISGTTQKPFDFRDFDLAIHSSGPNLADLGYLFGVVVPNTPAFILSTHATHHNHVVSFQQIIGRLGASTIQGDFTSDHSHPRRVITAHVHADVLRAGDLAVFFSPRPPHAATRAQPGVVAKPGGQSQKPFDVAGLQSLDALFDLWAGTVTGYRAPLDDVRLHLVLRNGHLELRPLSAKLSPGRIEAVLTADADARGLALRADVLARGVRVAELTPSKSIGGVFDGAAHLTGAGVSPNAILAHAQGAMAFRLMNGAIKRSQADALAGDPFKGAWAALTAKSAEVALTCARGRFALRNGVLTPTDLLIATSEGDAVGQGSIDLGRQRIDLTLTAAPQSLARPAIDAPIHLTGAFPHPKVSIDIARAVKQSGFKAVGALISAPFKGKPPPVSPVACPAPD